MKYYMIECKDPDHPSGPLLKKYIWNSCNILIMVECYHKEDEEYFKELVGQPIYKAWKQDSCPYNYKIKQLTKEELFLEML